MRFSVRERLAWFLAIGCAIGIFCTIPLARTLQEWVGRTVGREAFTYGVLAAGAIAFAFAATNIRRFGVSRWGYVWLVASAAGFAGYTFALDASPEESVHFVEYGLLAILVFAALSKRSPDLTIYPTTFFIGASVGVVDEAIQWLVPKRVWDLRDIGLNALGVALVVLPIALGIRPPIVRRTVTPDGVRRMTTAVLIFVGLLGLCLLNTPDRIRWYATNIPGLGFLLENESLMIEYGHRYEDPEIGVFRSRFDAEALARLDETSAERTAAILDEFHSGERYGAFLAEYTAAKAPFVHEARVHLFRRDHYRRTGYEAEGAERGRRLGIAFREHQIMARYFPRTLALSKFRLSDAEVEALEAEASLDEAYESPVSQGLFTRIGERSVVVGLLLTLALVVAYRRRYAAVMVAAMVGCAAPAPSPPADEPSLEFVFYTDVHARAEFETPRALALAARRINEERPQLVIAGGDVITDGFQSTAEAVAHRWDVYLAMVDAIDAPVRHVIGNHDLVAADPDDGSPAAVDPRRIWREKVGAERSYFSFDHGGYHFVFLDAIEVGGPLRYRGHVSDAQLAWLEDDLERVPRGTPIVAATHIPLLTSFYAATEGSTVAAPINRVVVNNREVLEKFEGHELVLVLQGHLHAKEALVWRGITFVTGGALSAKWWRGPWHGTEEGFTVISLRGRRVEWRYVELEWEAKR